MLWDEFATLLAGLNGDTPLGAIIRIRSEHNPDRIKDFTPEERRIRAEWHSKHARVATREEYDQMMASLSQSFSHFQKKGVKPNG